MKTVSIGGCYFSWNSWILLLQLQHIFYHRHNIFHFIIMFVLQNHRTPFNFNHSRAIYIYIQWRYFLINALPGSDFLSILRILFELNQPTTLLETSAEIETCLKDKVRLSWRPSPHETLHLIHSYPNHGIHSSTKSQSAMYLHCALFTSKQMRNNGKYG